MKCPICEKPLEPSTVITCRRCWQLVPPKERAGLRHFFLNEIPLDFKIARVVRIVREKNPEIAPRCTP